MNQWLDHMLHTPMSQLTWWELILVIVTMLIIVALVLAFSTLVTRKKKL
jgi:hypothetical protein